MQHSLIKDNTVTQTHTPIKTITQTWKTNSSDLSEVKCRSQTRAGASQINLVFAYYILMREADNDCSHTVF